MKQKQLKFINQTIQERGESPSGYYRHAIRSHVMRGKNAGKPRPSYKRSAKASAAIVPSNLSSSSTQYIPKEYQLLDSIEYEEQVAAACAALPKRHLFWNDLCLTSFPEELDIKSTKIMHRWFFDISDALFPPQFCAKYDIIKSIWFNFILADTAYFHCTLAVCASYINFIERKPSISSNALHHISRAYALVNYKLSSSQSVSDSAIAAVVTLTIYQQIHGLYAVGMVHLKGLARMIQLRGGIARLLAENQALALKPLRLDVELALRTGHTTLFRSDSAVAAIDGSTPPLLCSKQIPGISDELSDILVRVKTYAAKLNQAAGERYTKLDPLSYVGAQVAIIYRLLGCAPLTRKASSSFPEEYFEEATRLALLAFMAALLPIYGSEECNKYVLLSRRLESATYKILDTASKATEKSKLSLILWIIFISASSLLKHSDFRAPVANLCRWLNVSDWPSVRCQLSTLPWINELHDQPAQSLWDDSQLFNRLKFQSCLGA